MSLSHADDGPAIRVMTFNIRYNNPDDGENAWPHRKELVAQIINSCAPDMVGLQEALQGQLQDLGRLLPDFARCGVGRDDGKERGEFAAVLYRKDRLEALESGTFWYSDTPDRASQGWDNNRRIVTWVRVQDRRAKVSAKQFVFFNTHCGFTEEFRQKAPPLLRQRVATIADGHAVVVVGDFNMLPDSAQFLHVTRGAHVQPPPIVLTDAFAAAEKGHRGPHSTFHGFGEKLIPDRRIDYIFVGPGVRVIEHAILPDRYNGRPPSDHVPVIAEIVIE